MNANISNIQRFSLHDGHGIRSIAFFMGCPLRCAWCQNPEAMTREEKIMFNSQACIGCGNCLEACPTGAISADNPNRIDREKCRRCGRCCEACVSLALTRCGTAYTVDGLYEELMKDEAVFRRTGGGVTASGGEPMMHAEFVYELFSKLQAVGIHTAIETTGFCKEEEIRRISEVTDLFLFDIKAVTQEVHKKWTGVDNLQIQSNLRLLNQLGGNITVRVPLIPGVNDGVEFRRIADLAASLKEGQELHILPFHKYGESKYTELGRKYPCSEMEENTEENIETCRAYAISRGLRVNRGGMGFLEASENAIPRDITDDDGRSVISEKSGKERFLYNF